jgi:putative membrane protein
VDTLYLAAKSLHIIGFISWFAGLFYIVRLFIYHAETSEQRPEHERAILHPQLELMQARLWNIITTPAMIATALGGFTMIALKLHLAGALEAWLHGKLLLLAGLFAYHFYCGVIRKKQLTKTCTWTSARLRAFNELATMFMVAIVCLAVFKTAMSAIWGVLGLLGLGVALMVGIKLYRRRLQRP